jgi:hypothetical protein
MPVSAPRFSEPFLAANDICLLIEQVTAGISLNHAWEISVALAAAYRKSSLTSTPHSRHCVLLYVWLAARSRSLGYLHIEKSVFDFRQPTSEHAVHDLFGTF